MIISVPPHWIWLNYFGLQTYKISENKLLEYLNFVNVDLKRIGLRRPVRMLHQTKFV